MDSPLDDEILSINAIYTDQTLKRLGEQSNIYSLIIPGNSHTSLRLDFPPEYPDVPPVILGTQSVGEQLAKGQGQHIVDLARTILSDIYVPGSPCIYDLLEELQSRLPHIIAEESEGRQNAQSTQGHGQQPTRQTDSPGYDVDSRQSSHVLDDKEPPWILSDIITEKKSVFVARCASVQSVVEAKTYLRHLLSADKKVAKATHNITAWRIRGEGETAYQDCDDDGETAAGGRLLHLMQLMDVWDAMVVVTRWYGGVQLGPDRFRIINAAARDSFVKGNLIPDSAKSQKSDGGKRSNKK